MLPLVPLLLLASFDGEAALKHAAALAALGPHPIGSPRSSFAAEYVASQFRAAGLSEVRLQEFQAQGKSGANVLGVLRASGPEFILVGAHHDTAPDAPGAYDDGGGVGVMIETARALVHDRSRPRTLVFASFDGEEGWAIGSSTPGSRAYVQGLGPDSRNLVAAVIVEMCGWKGGAPVFHTIAYADPMRPGASVIAPGWLVAAAQSGAREAGTTIPVGDPLVSWLYQPTVRAFRARRYGDDLSFLQAGLPAVFLSDSSFSAYYPWYHEAGDTADKIDAASLARMGQGVVGIVSALERTPRGPHPDPTWFAASGFLLSAGVLLAVGALSLVPGLARAAGGGGLGFAARLVQAALFVLLLWREPVVALWVLLLPTLVSGFTSSAWLRGVALLPAFALAGLGAIAWQRGLIFGAWLSPWEIGAAILACALTLMPATAAVRAPSKLPKPAKKGAKR
jgi:hypothetical protein